MKEKRINLKLSEQLHRQVKLIAILKGITINEYIEQAIEKSVKKDKSLIDSLIKE